VFFAKSLSGSAEKIHKSGKNIPFRFTTFVVAGEYLEIVRG
jgi:hypothetical protein